MFGAQIHYFHREEMCHISSRSLIIWGNNNKEARCKKKKKTEPWAGDLAS